MKTEHILVIRFSAMGDVAMTVPVIQSLAKQYPKVRITVLSRPFARPFFEDLAPNVGFMEADIKEEYKGVKGLNALYRRLIAKQFTANLPVKQLSEPRRKAFFGPENAPKDNFNKKEEFFLVKYVAKVNAFV